MTTYRLTLTSDEGNDLAGRILASLTTEDPAVMAATLRAAADRLDPPQPVRPAYRRGASGPIDFDDPALAGAVVHRGTNVPASLGLNARARVLRDANGLPNYAHDASCNTIHEAGPEPCPPPRIATSAEIDAMVCPDCTDDAHTYQPGRCALKPPWNGRIVPGTEDAACRGGECGEGHTYTAGCLLAQSAPVVVDAPGDRMDAPDAVLSPAAAEAVARVEADQDEAIMGRMRQRLTPDGCGPEHTFTGSCALTPPRRD